MFFLYINIECQNCPFPPLDWRKISKANAYQTSHWSLHPRHYFGARLLRNPTFLQAQSMWKNAFRDQSLRKCALIEYMKLVFTDLSDLIMNRNRVANSASYNSVRYQYFNILTKVWPEIPYNTQPQPYCDLLSEMSCCRKA